jgi:hypothetical protein
MRMRNAVLLLLLCLATASCNHYTAVEPGRRVVEGGLAVEPGIRWAKSTLQSGDSLFSTGGPVEVWTQDGAAIDRLTLIAGVRDGQPILKVPGTDSDKLPPFRSAMTPNEVMELFEAALSKQSKAAIAGGRNLRPAKIGDADGFRFELSYTPSDNVDRELVATGAVKEGKLYLIIFQADRLYHFGRYLPEYESIVTSARIIHS